MRRTFWLAIAYLCLSALPMQARAQCCLESWTIVCTETVYGGPVSELDFDPGPLGGQGDGTSTVSCAFGYHCDDVPCVDGVCEDGDCGGSGSSGGGGDGTPPPDPFPRVPDKDPDGDKKMNCWKWAIDSLHPAAYTQLDHPEELEGSGFATGCGMGTRPDHLGMDYPCNVNEVVRAVHTGRVTESGFDPDKGNYVRIEFGDYYYEYQHLNSISPGITPSITVGVGAIIGKCGKTGASSDNWYHLHLGIGQRPGPGETPTTEDGYVGRCAMRYMNGCP